MIVWFTSLELFLSDSFALAQSWYFHLLLCELFFLSSFEINYSSLPFRLGVFLFLFQVLTGLSVNGNWSRCRNERGNNMRTEKVDRHTNQVFFRRKALRKWSEKHWFVWRRTILRSRALGRRARVWMLFGIFAKTHDRNYLIPFGVRDKIRSTRMTLASLHADYLCWRCPQIAERISHGTSIVGDKKSYDLLSLSGMIDNELEAMAFRRKLWISLIPR